MVSKKFDELFNKYRNATCIEDRRIKVKLKEIIACYDECDLAEQEFTSEIIDKFCEMIELIEERNEDERQALIFKYNASYNTSGNNFISVSDNISGFAVRKEEDFHRTERYIPFENDEALMVAFYNHFRNEQKKKLAGEKIQYPPIYKLDDLKDGKKVNSTMKDYVARMKTFANSYMYEIPRIDEFWEEEPDKINAALFIYRHLELILAGFNTREEDGSINKQKGNIQSALRKLNEFKREWELYRR